MKNTDPQRLRRFQPRLPAILLWLAAFIFANVAIAVENERILKVGIFAAPPDIIHNQGKASGCFPELFDALATEIGVRYEFRHLPWDQNIEGIKNGSLDIVLGMGYSENRMAWCDFNQETWLSGWGVVCTTKKTRINSMLDLAGKRVAGLKGDIFWEGQSDSFKELMTGFGFKCSFIDCKTFDEAVLTVRDGKADACVLMRSYLDSQFAKATVVSTPIVFKPVRLHIAFVKDGAIGKEFIPKFDEALVRMKEDKNSAYYRIMDKYFQTYSVVTRTPPWLWRILAAITAAVCAVFILAHYLILRRTVRFRTLALEDQLLRRSKVEEKLNNTVTELQAALSDVKQLKGLIPICSCCKKVRDDKGYWQGVEKYISTHSEATFSHGLCPDCLKSNYPDYADGK